MTTLRRGFQPRSRSRRTTDWGLGPADTGGVLSASGKSLWETGTAPAQNLTVVRTRGLIHLFLTGPVGVGDGYFGAVGIYLMTAAAFAIGVTAALSPLSESNSDMWLWHSFFDVRALNVTAGDKAVSAGAIHQRIEIDSKAMRKDFDPERVMVGVTAGQETGTAVLNWEAETRQLFKT